MNMADKKQISGFSLIELTLVIMIIAFLVGTIVFSTQARLDASRIFITKSRMETIVDAMDRYVENYGHIPCPALISVPPDDPNYGWGSGTNSDGASCIQSLTFFDSGNPTNGEIAMGMVPYKTLIPNVDGSIAVDGWGNRFSYFVTERYTRRINYRDLSDIGNNYVISSQPDGGSPYDYVSTNGVGGDIAYILLSHGPNGAYAYKDKDGSQISVSSPTAVDTENGVAGDNQFVVRMPDATNDDILLYKNKWQLPSYINE